MLNAGRLTGNINHAGLGERPNMDPESHGLEGWAVVLEACSCIDCAWHSNTLGVRGSNLGGGFVVCGHLVSSRCMGKTHPSISIAPIYIHCFFRKATQRLSRYLPAL